MTLGRSLLEKYLAIAVVVLFVVAVMVMRLVLESSDPLPTFTALLLIVLISVQIIIAIVQLRQLDVMEGVAKRQYGKGNHTVKEIKERSPVVHSMSRSRRRSSK